MENNITQETALQAYAEGGLVADLTSGTMAYSSMNPQTEEEKKTFFNAMNNSDKRLADMINLEVNIRDIYVEIVNCINEKTGESSTCPRVVLIDTDGVSYQCVSFGIYSALKKMINVYGEPTWPEGIKIKVRNISKKDKSLLTFDIV